MSLVPKIASSFHSLLDDLPVAVVWVDTNGRIHWANQIANEWFNLEYESLWASFINDSLSSVTEHGLINYQSMVLKADTAPINEGGQLITFTELTHLPQSGLSDPNDTFVVMGKLVASLAHQLRTPLAAAILYNQSVQRSADSPNVTTRAEKVANALETLQNRVDDMLLFTKSGASVVSKKSIASLIEEAIAHIQSDLITCHITGPTASQFIPVNTVAFVGAIENIINNAIEAYRHTQSLPADGAFPIWIDLQAIGDFKVPKGFETVKLPEQTSWVLSITDHAGGAIACETDTLFDAKVTHKPNGTGLGLSVVKEVMDSHGIDVILNSKTNLGFQVILCIKE